ncbi:MAG: hypothetical protein MMC23_001080 [Stictis urceolatum]|nr:hypothetical protein [Stictis urceolata]
MPATQPLWLPSLLAKLPSVNEQQKYSKVDESSDSEDGLPFLQRSRTSKGRCTIILALTTIWLTSVALILWLCSTISPHMYGSFLSQRNTTLAPHEYVRAPCGATPDEATARGCVFEIMSQCWLPPACYDKDLEAEFLQHDWHFFLRDGPGRSLREIPVSEVKTGTHFGAHITFGFHLTHCWYMQRKLQRSTMKGGYVDSYIGNLDHVHHCEKMLLHKAAGLPRYAENGTEVEMPQWDELSDQATIRYPACDEYTTMARNEGWLV